jgi:hypothetical protein
MMSNNQLLNLDTDEFSQEQIFHIQVMLDYKTKHCSYCVDFESCLLSHGKEKVRRQPLRLSNGEWNYIPVTCLAKPCKYKETCCFSHNILEILYHPRVFKTKKCTFETQDGICNKNGKYCSSAHGDLRQASLWNINQPSQRYSIKSNLEQQEELNRWYMQLYYTYHKSSEDSCNVLDSKNLPNVQNRALRQEFANLRQQLKIYEQNIQGLKEAYTELHSKTCCAECRTHEFKYFYTCGHLVCENCRNIVRCPVCDTISNPVELLNNNI